MSASQSRVTDEINLDEFERRLRAAGAQQSQTEDPLAELSRPGRILAYGDLERRDASAARGRSGPSRARGPCELD